MSEIYPQSVFENQTNGTVFYKEGKLNDPMMPAKTAGIFESWRYSFDDGRQVFKATDGSDKVYEKRIVKDRFGNPHWSEWFEISEAENRGIKAIAINGQPLLLPNSDGAIKLHITPQMIDTYTKAEINRLIERGIAESNSTNYTYVPWNESCSTAYKVLRTAYPEEPDQDIINNYFIVEPKPIKGDIGQESNKATYFLYDTSKDDFVEVSNTADMRAYVSYSAFNEHANDDVAHITADERALWNKAADDADASVANIKDIYEKIAEYNKTIEDHMNDVGDIASPHISADERARLNSLYENTKELPKNDNRYVVNGGEYVLAYEQPQKSTEAESATVKNVTEITSRHDGDVLVSDTDSLQNTVDNIKAANNVISRVVLTLANVNITKKDAVLNVLGDTGYLSDNVKAGSALRTFELPINNLPKVISLKISDDTATATFTYSLVIEYKKMLAVDIGDPERKLAINLVGPEDALPSYNGTPLTDIVKDSAESAIWGNISGDIAAQHDLDVKIANAVANKINVGDLTSHLRFDVYRDGLIRSVCQQLDGSEETEVEVKAADGAYNKDTAIITGVKAKINELEEKGYVVYYTRLSIDNVSVYNNEDGTQRPVYFDTDNSLIEKSTNVVGAFSWDWPSNSFEKFDSIYLRGNNAEYITNAKVTIKAVKFGDITIGLHNDTTNKDYSITIAADTLSETAKAIAISSATNVSIEAAANAKIAANEVLSLGGKAYAYDDEKADNKVYIYGQEADERYANRAKFEEAAAAAAAAQATLDQETVDRKAADEALGNNVNDIATKLETETADRKAIDEKLETSLNDVSNELSTEVNERKSEADSNKKAAQDAIEAEASKREALEAKVDANKTEFDDYRESNDKAIEDIKSTINFETKENTETYNLVINDSEELTQTISDGTFEAAKRILFKAGTYSLVEPFDKTKKIDFSSIEYIKGETKTSVDLSELVSPIGYDNTKFETIDFIAGSDASRLRIEDAGNRVFDVDANGNTTVELKKEYSIYDVSVKDDAALTFENVINGKEYVFYIDQESTVYNVTVTNFTLNNETELSKGLENQKANERTIIKAIGDNKAANNGLSILEVVYGVSYSANAGASVKVVAKDTKKNLYKSTELGKTVNYDEDEVITIAKVGGTFTLSPAIENGWAHAEDGNDYTVRLSSNGTIIGYGKCDEETTFKVPVTVNADEDGSLPNIEVVFNLKPQLASIVIDDVYADYINFNTATGLTKVQTVYSKASVSYEAKNGYALYGLTHSQISGLWQGAFPYEFVPAATKDRKDYDLYIEPKFYADYNDFTLTTVSSWPFNKEKVALVGSNTFTIKPDFIADVSNDSNFGTLFTAAPLSLDNDNAKASGNVYFTDNGKTQEAQIAFDESLVDTYVDLSFAIANHGDLVVKKLFIGKIGGSTVIQSKDGLKINDKKYILNVYAEEAKEFSFYVDLPGTNDFTGVWTTSGNGRVATVKAANENSVTVTANSNGTTTLSFTSNFSGLTYEVSLEVRAYAKKIICNDVNASTDSKIAPAITYYDFNGKEISSTKLYDASGVYTVADNSEYLDDDYESYIIVKNVALPNGAITVEDTYSFRLNDQTLAAEVEDGTVVVSAKKFKISYTIKDGSHLTQISLIGVTGLLNSSCYATKGTAITVIAKVDDSYKADIEPALKAAFGNCAVKTDNYGYFLATVEMPGNDVRISFN